MENSENMGQAANKTDAKPNFWKRQGDGEQVVIGFYDLKQSGNVVGKLLVKPGSTSAHTIEHWGLYTTYRWPSDSNTTESITFEYQGAHTTISVVDFKAALPSGSTYVEAPCTAETI
jgi:hypothetical protein